VTDNFEQAEAPAPEDQAGDQRELVRPCADGDFNEESVAGDYVPDPWVQPPDSQSLSQQSFSQPDSGDGDEQPTRGDDG
jgi:hypothetical protein